MTSLTFTTKIRFYWTEPHSCPVVDQYESVKPTLSFQTGRWRKPLLKHPNGLICWKPCRLLTYTSCGVNLSQWTSVTELWEAAVKWKHDSCISPPPWAGSFLLPAVWCVRLIYCQQTPFWVSHIWTQLVPSVSLSTESLFGFPKYSWNQFRTKLLYFALKSRVNVSPSASCFSWGLISSAESHIFSGIASVTSDSLVQQQLNVNESSLIEVWTLMKRHSRLPTEYHSSIKYWE